MNKPNVRATPKKFRLGRRWFVAVLITVWAAACNVVYCRAESCMAAGCHATFKDRKFVHAPVEEGNCLSCHRQENQAHPSGSKKEFTLTATGGPLCFQCHKEDGFKVRHRHGPAASGNCTVCHDPHGSASAQLLRMPLKELCLDCHQDFAKQMKDAAHLHPAISKLDCDACHLSHGSDSPNLLKGDGVELCFGCHDNIRGKYNSSLIKHKALYIRKLCGNCHLAHFSQYPVLLVRGGEDLCYSCHGQDNPGRSDALPDIRAEIEGKEVVHGPVAEGECIACHDPHGSGHAGLLTGSFPKGFYAPYQPDAYDFCFQCHDKELLTAQPANEQTGFRNGADNLHYRHVARKVKGRACLACHSVHASDGKKLINPDGIPFGKWKIPIRFAATESGGGCVPGCHRSLNYDRVKPVDYSKPQAAGPEKRDANEVYLNAVGPKKAGQGDAGPEKVEPKKAEQGAAGPKKAEPKKAEPKKAGRSNAGPSATGGSEPLDTGPEDTKPLDTKPPDRELKK